jgi:hypothetical protein
MVVTQHDLSGFPDGPYLDAAKNVVASQAIDDAAKANILAGLRQGVAGPAIDLAPYRTAIANVMASTAITAEEKKRITASLLDGAANSKA